MMSITPEKIIHELLTLPAKKLELAIQLLANEVEEFSDSTAKHRFVKTDDIPVSLIQLRWLSRWLSDSTRTITQHADSTVFVGLIFQGELNTKALENSINLILRRHSTLRSNINSKLNLVIRDYQSVNLASYEIQSNDVVAIDNVIFQLLQPFDLTKDSLFRVALIKHTSNHAILLFAINHLVFDGWSHTILIRELQNFYTDYLEGNTPLVDDLPIEYDTYALIDRSHFEQIQEQEANFWQNELRTARAFHEFEDFADFSPRMDGVTKTHQCVYRLDGETFSRFQMWRSQYKMSGFAIALTLLSVLLSCYLEKDDMVIFTPVANRTKYNIKGLIGLFASSLAIRILINRDEPFNIFLRKVNTKLSELFEHSYRYHLNAIGIYPDQHIQPILAESFEVYVDYTTEQPDFWHHPNLQVTPYQRPNSSVNIRPQSFMFLFNESKRHLELTVVFDNNRFKVKKIENMLEAYGKIIHLLSDDSKTLLDINRKIDVSKA